MSHTIRYMFIKTFLCSVHRLCLRGLKLTGFDGSRSTRRHCQWGKESKEIQKNHADQRLRKTDTEFIVFAWGASEGNVNSDGEAKESKQDAGP